MQYLYSSDKTLLKLLAESLHTHELGDMPNLETPTMGGEIWWDTIMNINGWKLQVNRLLGNARILDENNIRKAWGSKSAMEEKLKRLTLEAILQPGDIIGVNRGLYEHYAVYIGDDKVIHYASPTGDFDGEVSVHEAPMSEFLRADSSFFFINFPDENGRFEKIYVNQSSKPFLAQISDTVDIKKMLSGDYHLYSPEETIARAKSRLGETQYDLALNNCEHFAFWCKTGLSDSHQVTNFIHGIANARTILTAISDTLQKKETISTAMPMEKPSI